MIPSRAMSASAQTAVATNRWLRTLFEAPGRPVWLVGVGLALSGLAALAVIELALGRLSLAADDPNVLDNLRVAATHVVITAYLLTAYVYAQRSTERTITALRPWLDEARAEPRLAHTGGQRLALALSVVVGVVVAFVVNTRISPGEVTLLPSTWTPEEAWHRVLGLVMAILVLRLSTLLVIESGRLSDLAAAIRRIDLLSLEATSPFARQGLTYALLVVGMVSAFALFLVDLRYLPLVGLVLGGTVGVAGVALVLPVRGIHARIVEAKREELRWCHDRMRERRARIADGASPGDDARLEELVAWEARIEAVREWPFDAATVQRFGLYLLLPLGSWAGAALVERAIDALLD